MIAAKCSCGFTELDDENLTDHLQLAFVPDDLTGKDGQVHEEGESLACFCGYTASTPENLDSHFLAAFTPDDAIGRDDKKHEARHAALPPDVVAPKRPAAGGAAFARLAAMVAQAKGCLSPRGAVGRPVADGIVAVAGRRGGR